MVIRKDSRVTTCTFSQNLESKFWHESMKSVVDNWQKDRMGLFRAIYKALVRYEGSEEDVVKIALVIHDKDKSVNGDLVTPHIHGFIQFSKKTDLDIFANYLGTVPEALRKLQRGKHSATYAQAYLIHARNPEKYQYDVSDVETFDTYNYKSFIENNYVELNSYSATKKATTLRSRSDWLADKILDGSITKTDIMTNDEYFSIYARSKRKIDDILLAYEERQIELKWQNILAGKRKLTTVYVYGSSDAGKSDLSLNIADKLVELFKTNNCPLTVYSASATNGFDSYKGEDVVVLDDLRPGSLNVSDWLKILDPLNRAEVSARYNNKKMVANLIMLPINLSPKDFFGEFASEDVNQFLRRLTYVIHILDDGTMRTYNLGQTIKKMKGDFYKSRYGLVDINFITEDVLTDTDRDKFVDKVVREFLFPKLFDEVEE